MCRFLGIKWEHLWKVATIFGSIFRILKKLYILQHREHDITTCQIAYFSNCNDLCSFYLLRLARELRLELVMELGLDLIQCSGLWRIFLSMEFLKTKLKYKIICVCTNACAWGGAAIFPMWMLQLARCRHSAGVAF